MHERERLLTVNEVAERLALRPTTIRRMILERRIDVVHPSRRAVRIPARAVDRIVQRGFRAAISSSTEEAV
jgi:excisionase family DNA binding protein